MQFNDADTCSSVLQIQAVRAAACQEMSLLSAAAKHVIPAPFTSQVSQPLNFLHYKSLQNSALIHGGKTFR